MQEAASEVGRAEPGKACQLLPPQQGESQYPHPHLQPHSSFSQQSDSSYDFLSAEEKECLLFLEKTIGSLEAEADSGLSTDESEPATSPRSFRALSSSTQQAPQGKSLSGKQHSEDQSLLNTSHLAHPLGQAPRLKREPCALLARLKLEEKRLPEKPASRGFIRSNRGLGRKGVCLAPFQSGKNLKRDRLPHVQRSQGGLSSWPRRQ